MRPQAPIRSAAVHLLIFGAAFAAPSVWMWREQLEIRRWPAIEARSTGSQVVSYPAKNGALHRAQYVLRYGVAGTQYEIPFSTSASHSSEARAAADASRYDEGTTHRIHYNPAEPFDVREDVGPRSFLLPVLFSGIGAIMIAIGVAILVRVGTRPPGPRCNTCLAPVERTFRYCAACGTVQSEAKSEMPEEWGDEGRDAWEAERAASEANEARRNRTGNRIGGAALAVIGIALLVFAAIIGYARYEAATAWPAVEGVVTRSKLDWEQGREGKRVFRPDVELRYRVAGSEYRSVAKLDPSASYAWARRAVERSPVGARRTLRYDPAAPADILLDEPASLDSFVVPAVLGALGAVFTPLGLALLARGVLERIVFCVGCRRRLLGRRRFCPHCGTPAAAAL